MKIKTNNYKESFFYCLFCIISLGFWYISRIVITRAIKQAIEETEWNIQKRLDKNSF